MISSQYATLTISGVRLQFQGIAPFAPVYTSYDTTLNNQYSVRQNTAPASAPKVQCFGIGIDGFYMNSTNLAQPYMPKATNVHLHLPIPFRVVPVANDLEPEERALYRMRQKITVDSEDYFAYWLKLLTYPTENILVQRIDPAGVPTVYTPTEAELASTPTQANVIATDDQADIINTSFVGQISVTYAEVMEAINVLYAGDILQARISEVGLFSGSDESIVGANGSGDPLSYNEMIYSQLFYHRCSIGTDMTAVDSLLTANISIRDGNLVLRA